jgi:hypothetical protein
MIMMNLANMRTALSSAACAALLLASVSASADSFTFTGVSDYGPLSGESFSGSFSYAAAVTDGDVALSSFSFTFAGQTYTLASGIAGSAYASFSGGEFLGINYVDNSSSDTAVRPAVSFVAGFFSLAEAQLYYTGADGATGFGSYSVTAVPEPESYALMLGGLGALALIARRRKQQKQQQH